MPARSVIQTIDWQQPWLQDWRGVGERVAHAVAQGVPVHEALNREPPDSMRFVPQHCLPEGQAYEDFIFSQQACPTRDGLHDFFNGLCWRLFPHTKRRLNALQAAQIATLGVGAVRGPVRDAITVFDENAALFIGPDALWDALLARDWQRLYVQGRAEWAQARVVLFGHALLEKLVTPRKNITTHVYRVNAAPQDVPSLDAWLAHDLSADKLATKPFVPMPVSGVPGWWADNDQPDFYADTQVFRPLR